ncbi:hypothetical protein D3C72_2400250 [compost metagenome]
MATPSQENQFKGLQQARLQMRRQHGRAITVWLQLAGMGSQGLALAGLARFVDLQAMRPRPGQAWVVG